MKKWEYLVDGKPNDRKERVAHLNRRGGEGWELVAVSTEWFYFKREIAK